MRRHGTNGRILTSYSFVPVDWVRIDKVGTLLDRNTRRIALSFMALLKRPQTKEEPNMSKGRDRIVYQRPDGRWANKRNDKERASSVRDTQKDAQKDAIRMLRNQGGGELTTKGRNAKIRSKDTIAPGNDPNPPKDKEH